MRTHRTQVCLKCLHAQLQCLHAERPEKLHAAFASWCIPTHPLGHAPVCSGTATLPMLAQAPTCACGCLLCTILAAAKLVSLTSHCSRPVSENPNLRSPCRGPKLREECKAGHNDMERHKVRWRHGQPCVECLGTLLNAAGWTPASEAHAVPQQQTLTWAPQHACRPQTPTHTPAMTLVLSISK